MLDILNMNNLSTLKKICKFLHIKNYSNLNKKELILIINKYHSIKKIQKWIRKIYSKNENCPISFESIKYPCYSIKVNNNFIYYNLCAIRSYLIKTGDFRDPMTRILYTDKQLLEMDTIYKYYNDNCKYSLEYNDLEKTINNPSKKIRKNTDDPEEYFNSVYKASKNTRYYEKIKEKEQELLILERLLDMISGEIMNFISDTENDNLFILNTLYLNDYQIQFNRLLNRSIKHALYVIDKHIENFNQLYNKEKNYQDYQYKLCEHVIVYMYQLKEDLYFHVT